MVLNGGVRCAISNTKDGMRLYFKNKRWHEALFQKKGWHEAVHKDNWISVGETAKEKGRWRGGISSMNVDTKKHNASYSYSYSLHFRL